MKKKGILSILFIIGLLPMLFNQYGGARGIREISGLINLFNPIGIASVIIFFIGVWLPLKNKHVNEIIGLVGIIGISVSEIYMFLTWPVSNYINSISLKYSFTYAFPEFYIGLLMSITMIFMYYVINKKIED